MEIQGRLDTGRKLLKLEWSAPDFFRIGVMAAFLKDLGTVTVVREEWMIAEIRETREGRQAITNCVCGGVKLAGGWL